EIVVLVRAGDVVEVVFQEATERIEVRRQHAGDVTTDGLCPCIRLECSSRRGIGVILVAAEEKQAVSDDGPAESEADIVVFERTGIERVRTGARPDEAVVASVVKHRAAEFVGPALGYHVDAGPNEVALSHIVGRDAHLYLLERVEGDRCDAGPVPWLAAQAERIVEV